MSVRLNLKVKKITISKKIKTVIFGCWKKIPEFEKLQLKMRWWSVIYRRVWDVIGIRFCADWIWLKNVKYAYILRDKVKMGKNVFFCDFCIELQSIVKHCMQTVIFLQSVYYLYFIQIYNSFCLFFLFLCLSCRSWEI